MSEPVECQLCRQPVRSGLARRRRIGGRCWRKLTRAERNAVRQLLALTAIPSAARVRAALNQPAPAGDGQLPLEETDMA
ncbi:hypothetical protein [Streptomyces sp. NBC_00620]|uniref:hypothetical protein n=1 Tax=Streptomyces sp. NBC_00620 TaxID=2903666 RepID=UPI00225AA894|nr:hypothetical protein [Streptomyces sp. NBC_00620]MCX4974261.1 hypothetical protein [Streptomyces sp. NBC_00620]